MKNERGQTMLSQRVIIPTTTHYTTINKLMMNTKGDENALNTNSHEKHEKLPM